MMSSAPTNGVELLNGSLEEKTKPLTRTAQLLSTSRLLDVKFQLAKLLRKNQVGKFIISL